VLLVHAGALQRRHERGSRPTAGAQATLERQLVADELFNRKGDAWPHRSPLDCISLTKRSVELKGNATVSGMSAECVLCKAARLFLRRVRVYISRTTSGPNVWTSAPPIRRALQRPTSGYADNLPSDVVHSVERDLQHGNPGADHAQAAA